MKTLFLACLAILIFNVHAQAYDLAITIPNIKNTKGMIHVAVYNSKNKKDFTKIGKEFRVLDFKTEGVTGKYVIKDLPEGEYAVAIYQDGYQ